jgi:hypothetical protein
MPACGDMGPRPSCGPGGWGGCGAAPMPPMPGPIRGGIGPPGPYPRCAGDCMRPPPPGDPAWYPYCPPSCGGSGGGGMPGRICMPPPPRGPPAPGPLYAPLGWLFRPPPPPLYGVCCGEGPWLPLPPPPPPACAGSCVADPRFPAAPAPPLGVAACGVPADGVCTRLPPAEPVPDGDAICSA